MRKDFGSKPWFFPLPVLIIASYNEDGSANAMNAAWGGLYDTDLVELCLSHEHRTTQNILARKAFTISFGDAAHVVPCDYVGIVSGNDTPDKLQTAGFTTEKSRFVDAPVIRELPVCLECQLLRVTEEGIILGRIVNVSADEGVLDAEGRIDVSKLQPIAFEPVHGGYHVLGQRVGTAFHDGKAL